jgi:isoamylase
MILAGDEFGRTQNGNNNAYCQDNEVSWVDWKFDENAESLIEFTKRLTGLRRRYPVLRQSRFLSGIWNEELGLKDATWLTPAGEEMKEEDWHNPAAKCLGLLLDGRAQMSGIRQRGSEATLLLITNAYHDVVLFTLPKVSGGRDWRRLLDTNKPEEDDDPDRPVLYRFGQQYQVTGRSLLLLSLRQVRSRRPPALDQSSRRAIAPGRDVT